MDIRIRRLPGETATFIVGTLASATVMTLVARDTNPMLGYAPEPPYHPPHRDDFGAVLGVPVAACAYLAFRCLPRPKDFL